jgi:hypothetical protein
LRDYAAPVKSLLAIVITSTTVVSAPISAASPEDPYGEDWVAVALSPEAGIGTYGAAGNPDQATQIALDECTHAATESAV